MRDLPEYKFEAQPSIKVIDPGEQGFPTWCRDVKHSLLIESHGHPFNKEVHRVSLKPEEGKFYQFNRLTRYYPSDWVTVNPMIDDHFPGRSFIGYPNDFVDGDNVYPTPEKPDVPDFSDYTLQLNYDGTRLWRLARPGHAEASLGQFVAELRDLPRVPALLYRNLKQFRELGNEYLNAQFGWAPFVNDLMKAYRLQKKLSKRLDDLRKNNQKKIKRRRADHTKTDTSVQQYSYDNINGNLAQAEGRALALHDMLYDTDYGEIVYPFVDHSISPYGNINPVDVNPPVSGQLTCTKEEITDVWFVARWFYYIPDIGSDKWTQKATNTLFGADLNPSVLYDSFPWSWFIDWFANFGDMVANSQSNSLDNELVEDAYIMRRVVRRKTIVSSLKYPEKSDPDLPGWIFPGASITCSVVTEDETKLRKQATPYGFGINFDSLSGYQQSILAALGISRARF